MMLQTDRQSTPHKQRPTIEVPNIHVGLPDESHEALVHIDRPDHLTTFFAILELGF